MEKLRNSTHQAFAAFACSSFLIAEVKGMQSFRTHGCFVPERFIPRLRHFVPNPLDDSYPTNYDSKCLKQRWTFTAFILVIAKKWIFNHRIIEKLLQWLLLLLEGLPKFEERPLHFTIGGPLYSLKLAETGRICSDTSLASQWSRINVS